MSMRYPGGFIASTPVTAGYPSGVWTQAQALPYQAQNVWTRDQFWPYTSLLLNGNGTNGAQNNTFLDSSSNNFTITRNGNTTQGTFSPYEQEGYWSNYFDGTTDYLSVANNAALQFGTGNFTIEAWVFQNTTSGTQGVCGNHLTFNGGGYGIFIGDGIPVGQIFQNGNGNTLAFAQSSAITVGTWNHIAFVRNGTELRMYTNGVSGNPATSSINPDNSSAFEIGSYERGGSFLYYFNGYISNLRVVKGTALYTTNFNPPTTPLPAITNTSLLTCQSNRFRDASTNNFAITRNGDTSVQAFQPFPGATTYSGTVLGGSGYFDGTGDYLTIPRTSSLLPGSGVDFTVEAWVYWTTLNNVIIGSAYELGGAADWALFAFGRFYIQSVNTSYDSSIGLNPYSWNHIAVSRSSNTLRIFVNGQIGFSGTVSASLSGNGTGPISIGADQNGDESQFSGYISQIRFVNGTALYTAAFTPPTAPLTAVTNTQLLLNFTNAGIDDSAVMNDLETVGNAQVSTSVVKYGTGSMAFDGTGDYLSVPDNPAWFFGTGNFTVELWYNPTTLPAFHVIVEQGPTDQNRWILYWSGTTGMSFDVSASNVVTIQCRQGSTAGWVAGNWYHVAVVRNGNVFTIYRNGVSIATATDTDSIPDFAGSLFVAGSNIGTDVAMNGYIDDLRITKGVARYITNFTPPPARLPGQ